MRLVGRQAERPQRVRVTFEADTRTLEEIKCVAGARNVSSFCVRAVQLLLCPAFRFFPPRPGDSASAADAVADLRSFLEGAREIFLVGVTLGSLQDPALREFLGARIAERVAMTFIMVDPTLTKGESLYDVLDTRYRGRFADALTTELQNTNDTLRHLCQLGEENGVPVRAMGLKDLPMCGLTVVNPYTDRCRIRVALYLQRYAWESYPIIEVAGQSPDALRAHNAFLQYYSRLSAVARPIEYSYSRTTNFSAAK